MSKKIIIGSMPFLLYLYDSMSVSHFVYTTSPLLWFFAERFYLWQCFFLFVFAIFSMHILPEVPIVNRVKFSEIKMLAQITIVFLCLLVTLILLSNQHLVEDAVQSFNFCFLCSLIASKPLIHVKALVWIPVKYNLDAFRYTLELIQTRATRSTNRLKGLKGPRSLKLPFPPECVTRHPPDSAVASFYRSVRKKNWIEKVFSPLI
jgi:hypothetical protein